ncbi:sugar-binding transcriptional regulator [Fodinicurvata sp. EGI_FJ10296]|uniref:sugar-binding transcriptional regulator n=1 Tax=Fodinicurvata sp. EGI_FJ10296 TaxID=3231908 RepID=UPI00345218D9
MKEPMGAREERTGLRAYVSQDYPRIEEPASRPVVRAAWLYHHDGLTQSEIARLMGVSRATIVNHLQAARESGLVHVSLDPDMVAGEALAARLSATYGLQRAMVAPDDGGRAEPLVRAGRAGTDMLLDLLAGPGTGPGADPTEGAGSRIGVAWGRTVMALAQTLPQRRVADLTVAQIVGSMSSEDGFSAEQCTSEIASRLGARMAAFHAPARLSDAGLAAALANEPIIRTQFDLLETLSLALFGICTVKTNSLVFGAGLVTAVDSHAYIERGAVGVIAGRFFDRQGKPVIGPIDDCLIGMTLDQIARVPVRLAVAAGPEKIDCLQGALAGGYVTHLATDEATALALLDDGPS